MEGLHNGLDRTTADLSIKKPFHKTAIVLISTKGRSICAFYSCAFVQTARKLGLHRALYAIKGLLHGYEWGLRFGGLELRFG